MSSEPLDRLKALYRFNEWRLANTGGEQLFVRNYRVTGDELPNRLLANRVARLGGARRVNTSTWEQVSVSDRPVVVDVFELPSREEAQKTLLELTAQFHRPVELDVKAEDVGDVRVATPDGSWFAFARGNLVVRVVSGDALNTAARSVAEQIDDALMWKPPAPVVSTGEVTPDLKIEETPTSRTAVRLTSFARVRAAEGEVEAAAEAAEVPEELAPEDEPFIKVFTKGGTVTHEGGLTISPEAGAVKVEVYKSEPGGDWVCERYQTPRITQPEQPEE